MSSGCEVFPVYVANLLHKTTVAELQSHFQNFGAIENIRFVHAPFYEMAMELKPKVGIICYKSEKSLSDALKADQTPFRSKRIHVLDARIKHPVPKDCSVLVGNLLKPVMEEHLYKVFRQAGPIERVIRFVVDKGLVIYKNSESARKALMIEKSFCLQKCEVFPFLGDMDQKVYYEESSVRVSDTVKTEQKRRSIKRPPTSYVNAIVAAKKPKQEFVYNPFSRRQQNQIVQGVYYKSPGAIQQKLQLNPSNIHPGNLNKLIELAFQAGKQLGEMNVQQRIPSKDNQKYVVKSYADKSYTTVCEANDSFQEQKFRPCYQTDNNVYPLFQ